MKRFRQTFQSIAASACALLVAGCAASGTVNAPAAPAAPQTPEVAEAPSWERCLPATPCSNPYPVKFVVVTMFERGELEGDQPGEFQFWKERADLDTKIEQPHAFEDLYLNEKTGVLGVVTGIGNIRSAASIMALGLDQRFDLTNAYWLVAGIAGIDPEDASIGSAVWSSHLIDGDLSHEIDAREKPEDWDFGYFPRYTQGGNTPTPREPNGEAFVANPQLRDWAFALTKDIALPDSEALQEARSAYTEHPNAQKPPFITTGGHIAALTFWHGALLNEWANRWVEYWSGGETDFVTSAMEETGTFQSIEWLHESGRVDKNRFMVLRAGSNYTMQPPGVSAAENLLQENKGYAGFLASLESLYLVGSRVVREITGKWDTYRDNIPQVQKTP